MNYRYNAAFAGSVASQSQGNILQLQGLGKSLSSAPLADKDKDTIKRLAASEERMKRQASLQAPESERIFEGDLMWMAAKGIREDLNLLRQVREDPPYWTDQIAVLFGLAEQGILACLSDPGEELQTAFGFTQAEFVHCLHGTDREPDSEKADQILEMLKQIKQSWENQYPPEGLKDWFRKPVPLLGGGTPFEAVMEGRAEEVWQILLRLEEGVHY